MKNIVYCLFTFISLSIMSCHDNDIIQSDENCESDTIADTEIPLKYKVSTIYSIADNFRMDFEYNEQGKVSKVYEVSPKFNRTTEMIYKYDTLNNCIYSHIKQRQEYIEVSETTDFERTDTIYIKNGVAESCSGMLVSYLPNSFEKAYYINFDYDNEKRLTHMLLRQPRFSDQHYYLEWENDNIVRTMEPCNVECIYEYYSSPAMPSFYTQPHPLYIHHAPLIEEGVFGKKSCNLLYRKKESGGCDWTTYQYGFVDDKVDFIEIKYDTAYISNLRISWSF
ncbi:MAG: hypothetical protein J6A70_01910 [Prevotella sp.]|nr:hypothetical protein [Prevotella sp.]